MFSRRARLFLTCFVCFRIILSGLGIYRSFIRPEFILLVHLRSQRLPVQCRLPICMPPMPPIIEPVMLFTVWPLTTIVPPV